MAPVALMKPLSGKRLSSMMIDTINPLVRILFSGLSIFNSSADATFLYCCFVFRFCELLKARYAIQAGLLADLAGVIAAIFVTYLFFG